MSENIKNASSAAMSPVIQILSGSQKGKQFRLNKKAHIVLGKASSCDVIFKDNLKCSDRHARVSYIEQNDTFLIESLDKNNLVFINDKASSTHIFKNKDIFLIGNIKMRYVHALVSKAQISQQQSQQNYKYKKPVRKKSSGSMMRLIFIGFICFALYLFFTESKTKDQKPKPSFINKTESELLKQIEEINQLTKDVPLNSLSYKKRLAKISFFNGFRDYRKGYFQRSLKLFQHCLILDKNSQLCQSYIYKANRQIENLLQKKMRLGKAYQNNQQYQACKTAFKQAEIMIQDNKNSIYKEAQANRKLCEKHLKDKII